MELTNFAWRASSPWEFYERCDGAFRRLLSNSSRLSARRNVSRALGAVGAEGTAQLCFSAGPDRAFRVRQGRPQLAFLRLLVACSRCTAIAPQGEHASYLVFTEVSQAVEAAERAGVLYGTEQPCWYEEGTPVLVGEQFFCCSECGAYWHLQLAEHSQRGSWERIA